MASSPEDAEYWNESDDELYDELDDELYEPYDEEVAFEGTRFNDSDEELSNNEEALEAVRFGNRELSVLDIPLTPFSFSSSTTRHLKMQLFYTGYLRTILPHHSGLSMIQSLTACVTSVRS